MWNCMYINGMHSCQGSVSSWEPERRSGMLQDIFMETTKHDIKME